MDYIKFKQNKDYMGIIKASKGFQKTMRNVGRLQEIVRVFGRNGFEEFISGNVLRLLPHFVLPKSHRKITEELENKTGKDWHQAFGFRLRKCFEELGPAFIKFGQLLSTRDDLFHQSFIDEMRLLQDQVKPVLLKEVLPIIEKSLGRNPGDVFLDIEEHPLGTASIGVVFKAKLKDGSPVVIKVKRPNIEKEIETDFSLLLFLSSQAEKVSEDLKYLGLTRIINDFSASLYRELNFNLEALNAEKLKKNLAKHDLENVFYIPSVYREFSSEDVIVLEFLKGIPFSDINQIIPHKEKVFPKMEYGVELFLKTFLKDGFFHADLHGGNFFYLENEQIGLIDFGLMGNLSKNGRHHFIAIIYALVSYNYENLVYEFLDLAEFEGIPDVDTLVRDVKEALNPFVGLTVRQTNFSDLLFTVITTLKKHQIFLPREWYIVFRALMTLDGAGKSLGIDLNVYGILEDGIEKVLKETFNKDELIEEGAWGLRDFTSTLKIFPRHFRWFIKDFTKKGHLFQVKNEGLENEVSRLTASMTQLSFSLMSGVMFFSGVWLIKDASVLSVGSIPHLSWIFWSGSMLLFTFGVSLTKKK